MYIQEFTITFTLLFGGFKVERLRLSFKGIYLD